MDARCLVVHVFAAPTEYSARRECYIFHFILTGHEIGMRIHRGRNAIHVVASRYGPLSPTHTPLIFSWHCWSWCAAGKKIGRASKLCFGNDEVASAESPISRWRFFCAFLCNLCSIRTTTVCMQEERDLKLKEEWITNEHLKTKCECFVISASSLSLLLCDSLLPALSFSRTHAHTHTHTISSVALEDRRMTWE